MQKAKCSELTWQYNSYGAEPGKIAQFGSLLIIR